jgi:ubiquinone/menaquinone biosynthesis C-methylase UbiE
VTIKMTANSLMSKSCQESLFLSCALQVSVDYLTKPLEVFREMNRVLKPGGLAVMR